MTIEVVFLVKNILPKLINFLHQVDSNLLGISNGSFDHIVYFMMLSKTIFAPVFKLMQEIVYPRFKEIAAMLAGLKYDAATNNVVM